MPRGRPSKRASLPSFGTPYSPNYNRGNTLMTNNQVLAHYRDSKPSTYVPEIGDFKSVKLKLRSPTQSRTRTPKTFYGNSPPKSKSKTVKPKRTVKPKKTVAKKRPKVLFQTSKKYGKLEHGTLMALIGLHKLFKSKK